MSIPASPILRRIQDIESHFNWHRSQFSLSSNTFSFDYDKKNPPVDSQPPLPRSSNELFYLHRDQIAKFLDKANRLDMESGARDAHRNLVTSILLYQRELDDALKQSWLAERSAALLAENKSDGPEMIDCGAKSFLIQTSIWRPTENMS